MNRRTGKRGIPAFGNRILTLFPQGCGEQEDRIASLANNLADVVRAGFRPREPRTRVHVPARMRVGDVWTDITILNVSSRGLMARAGTIPPPRSYVEIRRGAAVTIVGKVVWHDSRHFGIRTQDRISIGMLNNGTASAAPQHNPAIERRERPRSDRNDPNDAFDRSRRKAALFQFGFLALAAAAAAILIGSTVITTLGVPFSALAEHLG